MQDATRRGLLKSSVLGALAGMVSGFFSGQARAQDREEAMHQAQEARDRRTVELIEAAAEPLPAIGEDGFATFIDRFKNARVILLGEESHGTDEFYRARAAITARLVREHGFNIVALEADWPDAARVDAYVRGRTDRPGMLSPFQRFPTWMWRNRAMRDFVDRLHEINAAIDAPEKKAGVYGLDLYSLPSSMDAVVDFFDRYDPDAAEEVRRRYGCLAPWVDDPATYGALARSPRLDSCSEEVVSVIGEMLQERLDHIQASDIAYFNALQNARVVAAGEAYYRAMYEGSVASWNLRDTHMFETLQAVLEARGDDSRAVVWAHNSHIGNAAATEMGMRGEINIGQLARERFGEGAVLIGFGTDTGTVTAATDWNGPAETKRVRPALPESFGALMREAQGERFLLDLRNGGEALRAALARTRLERFIGVIYRPETERWSHYTDASLSRQFDAYLWFQETTAVEPLPAHEIEGMPETYPFAL
jgi:erythromycin esterase-like protein